MRYTGARYTGEEVYGGRVHGGGGEPQPLRVQTEQSLRTGHVPVALTVPCRLQLQIQVTTAGN